MAPAATVALVIEAYQMTVSSVIGAAVEPRPRRPVEPAYRTSLASNAIATTPGTSPRSIAALSRPSIWLAAAGLNLSLTKRSTSCEDIGIVSLQR
jgi:hypothetical protein